MPRNGRPYRRDSAIVRARTEACWRCGRPLDPTAHWPDPMFVTIGHLIAVEDGGTDHISNLAGECIRCNMGDGAHRTNRKRHGDNSTVWTNPDW